MFAEDEARLLLGAANSASGEQGPRGGGAGAYGESRQGQHDEVDRQRQELRVLVGRRVAGEPLEHILGWVDFRGLRLEVGRGVFVPRRRTEFLVDCAIDRAAPPLVAVDLCCGCGAVGAALTASVPDVQLYATEIDPGAVEFARRNLRAVRADVRRGDLFGPLPSTLRGRVDLVLVNAPYVPTAAIATMPPEARDHEPQTALDGGDDGLDVVRRIVTQAPGWLAPGGSLLIEISELQVDLAAAMLTHAGLRPTVASSADLGSTVITGQAGTMLW